MAAPHIYLDHNSTTPLDPRVLEAMERAWRDCGANPASQHRPGSAARRMLEEAREGIAELLGAKTGGMDADRVIFTSGGTEANNLAIRGLVPNQPPAAPAGTKPGSGKGRVGFAHRIADGRWAEPTLRLVIWPIEHPSIIAAAAAVPGPGFVRAKVLESGIIDLADLGAMLAGGSQLISLMLANNETGVIQPVAELARDGHRQDIIIHSDTVQAVGKIPVHFRDLGVDAMTVAPHKFHGPLGIGALLVRHELKPEPLLFGGFQQEGIRPGTENVALAVGFHRALELAVLELPERGMRMHGLRDALEQMILAAIPDAVVVGASARRLPNTSNISFPGVNRQALVMALDMAGVACSTGSACASGSSEPSPVLRAMGLPEAVVEGAIRLSLGAFTTAEEVAEAAGRIIKAVKHLRSRK
jgi:cysteine desulfurase